MTDGDGTTISAAVRAAARFGYTTTTSSVSITSLAHQDGHRLLLADHPFGPEWEHQKAQAATESGLGPETLVAHLRSIHLGRA